MPRIGRGASAASRRAVGLQLDASQFGEELIAERHLDVVAAGRLHRDAEKRLAVFGETLCKVVDTVDHVVLVAMHLELSSEWRLRLLGRSHVDTWHCTRRSRGKRGAFCWRENNRPRHKKNVR